MAFGQLYKELKIKIAQFNERNLPINENRKGQCNNCNGCCHLFIKCPFLKVTNGISKCRIYKYRPKQCRNSPRNEKFLKPNCGFYWDK